MRTEEALNAPGSKRGCQAKIPESKIMDYSLIRVSKSVQPWGYFTLLALKGI
jgi:hypothetical protein